jgi:hypothetical protein
VKIQPDTKVHEIDPNAVTSDEVQEASEMLSALTAPPKNREIPRVDGAPDWAVIPPGFNPPKGVQLYFMRFRGAWTEKPNKGERQCILWSLSVGDEKNALSRARGDVLRTLDEMSKQTVRAIDGQLVDWTGTNAEANLDVWWNEIGPRCRALLQRHYTQTHNLSSKEQDDFFENCIAAVVRD